MFGVIVSGRYADAAPNERVCCKVFLVQDGAIVGLARAGASAETSEAPAPEAMRGFWSRLFSSG